MTTLAISTSSNDCSGDTLPSFSNSSTGLPIGNISAGDQPTKVWIPFVVPINRGVDIVSATLRVIAASSESGETVTVKVGCEAEDNPSAPGSWASLNGRTMTTAYTTVASVPSWMAGTEYTFDVTDAVQEILNRAGFANGNTIAILIHDNGSTPDKARTISADENTSYAAAILEIVYSGEQQVIMI